VRGIFLLTGRMEQLVRIVLNLHCLPSLSSLTVFLVIL
jgi:hypothetical protein